MVTSGQLSAPQMLSNQSYQQQMPGEWQIPVNKSAETGEIAKALCAAQAEMKNPALDAINPHFKSKFASLATVRNAVVPVLAKHGIAFTQDLQTADGGIACITRLYHSSGQSLHFGPLVLPVSKNDAQGFGSASTYARRYHFMAVAGVVGDDDDDGNAAVSAAPKKAEGLDPRGDAKARVDMEEAKRLAMAMMEAMKPKNDGSDTSLACFDLHEAANEEPDLYIVAADQLRASDRSTWKKLVDLGRNVRRQLDQVSSNRPF